MGEDKGAELRGKVGDKVKERAWGRIIPTFLKSFDNRTPTCFF